MAISFGINPIGWTNDCMHWLGDDIPVETCLAEARAAGFSGIELGRKMPKQDKALRRLLDEHGLRLVGGGIRGSSSRATPRRRLRRSRTTWLHQAAARRSWCSPRPAATSSTMSERGAAQGRRSAVPSNGRRSARGHRRSPTFWRTRACAWRFTIIWARSSNRSTTFAGSWRTRPSVGLLLDTGHLTYGGGDPVAAVNTFSERIIHVHCKDIRGYALEACRRRDASFSEAICPASSPRRGMASSTIWGCSTRSGAPNMKAG